MDQARLAAEQTLLRSGMAGAGERRVVQLLGRRDDLQAPGALRRYDELAGRIAVADVTSRQDDTPGRWVPVPALPEPDVARWRADRGLTLNPAQRQIVERQTQDFGPSLGPDLGH